MSTVQLKKPYRIIPHKIKRYSLHYNIPALNCVVIPLQSYGEDVACDVRWEDSQGMAHLKERLFFNAENIEPVNEMQDFDLYKLWEDRNIRI